MIGRGVVVGAVLATGALMLVPGVAAAVARAGRPVLRTAMKRGASAYEEARTAAAEVYETVEDVAAEVRAEMSTPEGEAEEVGDDLRHRAAGAAEQAAEAVRDTAEAARARAERAGSDPGS
jgi:hypothetical protein